MKKKICGALLVVWFGLMGCSPVTLLNGLTPDAGYIQHSALAYGEGHRQKLDVYQPTRHTTPAPVVVFFYGGGWQSGERADYALPLPRSPNVDC